MILAGLLVDWVPFSEQLQDQGHRWTDLLVYSLLRAEWPGRAH